MVHFIAKLTAWYKIVSTFKFEQFESLTNKLISRVAKLFTKKRCVICKTRTRNVSAVISVELMQMLQ